MSKPGGVSITGRIVRAWTTQDGVTHLSVKTAAYGEMHGVMHATLTAPDSLIGRNVHYLNGSWFLTTSGEAGQ